MTGVFLAGLILATLVAARHFPSNRPIDRSRSPLDIDDGIPFPEAGQASSIFSLTALFGTYLGIGLMLGLSALLGLLAGSVVGLVVLQRTIASRGRQRFDFLLQSCFKKGRSHGAALLAFIALTQALLVLSEMLILREISGEWLGISSSNATLFVFCLSLIAYLYCLDGGYLAVFRTDIIQFIFILVFGIILCVFAFRSGNMEYSSSLGKNATAWLPPSVSKLSPVFNAATTFVMGFMWVIGSPDTWKRVHVIVHSHAARSLVPLMIAGAIPFMLITPLVFLAGSIKTEEIAGLRFLGEMVSAGGSVTSNMLLLGIVASFMSSFDSFLTGAVHLLVVSRRFFSIEARDQKAEFYRSTALVFILINAAFAVVPRGMFSNPYLLANILLGNFAVAVGVLIGTGFFKRAIKLSTFVTLSTTVLAAWTSYVCSRPGLITTPSIEHLHTIPAGVWGCFLIALIARLASKSILA